MQTSLFTDDRIVEALASSKKHLPDEWASRLLYLGEAGFHNWLSVVHESSYPLQRVDHYQVRTNCLAALEKVIATSFVSLGPGEGLNDIPLVQALRATHSDLSYIPVDISAGMLDAAVRNLGTMVDVPFAVQCDFESGLAFVRDRLNRHAPQAKTLFALLGGTVGNLDLGVRHFCNAFRSALNPGDYWLLDVPLAGPAWTPTSEPRLNKASYTPAFRRFVAGGIVRAGAAASEENAVSEFDRRIDLSLEFDHEVGETRVVTVRDLFANRVLLRFRRFGWQSFLDWLHSRGFSTVFAECSISSDDDTFGMGVVLLQYNRPHPSRLE